MKLLNEIEGLVSSQINVIKAILSIMRLEARLASLSIIPVLVSILMILIVVVTTWESAMVLFGYLIFLALNSPVLAILLTLLFNVACLVGLGVYLLANLKHMSFEKTRKYLSLKENHHDDEKTNNSQDRGEGKGITIPSSQSGGA